jgi:peptidoglycan/xylan/chitin deacetylase (PgdA/CDA1 family)
VTEAALLLPTSTRRKITLARLLESTGVTDIGLQLQRVAFSPYIRVVYYHDVSPSLAGAFERQLQFLSRHFVPATRGDLEDLLRGGQWSHRRPGVLLTFDDGLRSHAEVVAPLLEQYGHQGWFFVPIGLTQLEPSQQPEAARRHWVPHDHDVREDPRVFLTRTQLHALANRHIVGCHTINHRRLSADLATSVVREETVAARDALAAELGQPVDTFAWVGGEESAYSGAAAAIVAQNFQLAFTTNCRAVRPGASPLQLQRTHLEAWFPPQLLQLHLSGLMDLFYAAKRRRLGHLFAETCKATGGRGGLQIPG